MSLPVSNESKVSYGKTLLAIGAVAGTAIVNPVASLALGAFFVGRTLFWNQSRKVEIQHPQPQSIQPAISESPVKEFIPESVQPSVQTRHNSLLETAPKKIEKRKWDQAAQKEEPFESKENFKTQKTRSTRAERSQPASLKCASTLASRRLAKGRSVAKCDAGALQKTLQKDRIATALAENLKIDLERANSQDLQTLQELSSLVSTLRKAANQYRRKGPNSENQHLSQTETSLSRDLKFRADGSILILDKILGQGTFKKVMRAVDVESLKVYASSEFLVDNEETQAEIQFVNQFKNDDAGLVKTYSIETFIDENGETRTSMLQELYGSKLTDLIEEKTLSKKEKIQIAVDSAYALAKIHGRGFCHLDFKPDNLLTYFDENGNRRAVLADYDQTCLVNTPISSSGTEGFKAPELETGSEVPSSPKMDVYSFGATLRSHLFRGRGLSTLSEETQAIVNRMIDSDPAKRSDIGEVLAAFQQELERIETK